MKNEALVEEYLELSATKLGLDYTGEQEMLKTIKRKSALVLQSNIAKLRKLEDYDAAPVFSVTVAAPVITPDTSRSGQGGLTGLGRKTPDTITDAQLRFFSKLMLEKHGIDLNDEKNTILLAGAKKLTKFQAMREIDTLKGIPTLRTVAPVNAPAPLPAGTVAIPDGIYAIDHDGETKCYEISNGKAGSKWEGFIFLDRVSSDDRYSIRNRDEKARILDAIREDVEVSGRLAAQTLRRCRNPKCKRTLSDTKNPYFEMGYGPECGSRV